MLQGRSLSSNERLHTLATYLGLSYHTEKSGLSLHTASAGPASVNEEGASAEVEFDNVIMTEYRLQVLTLWYRIAV